MLGPALRSVKETSPGARLTLLASPSGSAAAALLPWIDEVIVWRPVWQDLGQSSCDPERDRELFELLAHRGFDGALIFTSFSQTPQVPGYVCYLAGIPLRAGESKEFGGATLTDELRGAPEDIHQVERNLRLVEQLGFSVRDRNLGVFIPDCARAVASEELIRLGLDPNEPFVLVHPGASASARRLPADRLIIAIRQMRSEGISVLVSGSERELELVTMIGRETGVPALCGAPTLIVFAALVESASVLVSGNSMPLHLADAVGTPLVVLFAGTDLLSQWRPRAVPHRLLRRDTPCTPCYRFDCPIGQPCLDIEPEEIIDAVTGLLECGSDRPSVVATNKRGAA